VIGEWYHFYDSKLNSYCGNSESALAATNYAKAKAISRPSQPSKFNSVIKVKKLMEPNEIARVLYNYANFGPADQNAWFATIPKPIDFNVKNKDYIGEISGVKIHTMISDEELDLTEYAKINGVERAEKVSDCISNEIKNKVNCLAFKKFDGSNLTPEEVVVAIYAGSSKFGMGNFDLTNRVLTLADAKQILSESLYIDYLDGKAFKLSFSTWPILDIRQFSDRNGPEHFANCISMYIGIHIQNSTLIN
jgi:hypothetical protein